MNTYVFELYSFESAYPIRRETVRTRKGPEQAQAALAATGDEYNCAIGEMRGPITERIPA